jgi:hypothetical protein
MTYNKQFHPVPRINDSGDTHKLQRMQNAFQNFGGEGQPGRESTTIVNPAGSTFNVRPPVTTVAWAIGNTNTTVIVPFANTDYYSRNLLRIKRLGGGTGTMTVRGVISGTPEAAISIGPTKSFIHSAVNSSVVAFPFTLVSWFKTANTSTLGWMFQAHNLNNPFRNCALRIVDTRRVVAVNRFSVGSQVTARKPGNYADGAWHMIAGQFGLKSLAVSIDGGAWFNTAVCTLNTNNLNTMFIGRESILAAGGWDQFDGEVDECAQFDGILTNSDLTALWNGGRGRFLQNIMSGKYSIPSNIKPKHAYNLTQFNPSSQIGLDIGDPGGADLVTCTGVITNAAGITGDGQGAEPIDGFAGFDLAQANEVIELESVYNTWRVWSRLNLFSVTDGTTVVSNASVNTIASPQRFIISQTANATIQLPAPAQYKSIVMRVKRQSNTAGTTVVTTHNTATTKIDNANTYNLTGNYRCLGVVSDGANWWIIDTYGVA